MIRFLRLMVLSIPLIFILNLNATAATFVVTQFNDTNAAAPNGCNIGGACSLREAVLAANALPDPDTIQLSAGTYNLSIPEVGAIPALDGDLDITEPATIQGAGQTDTIINGVQPGLADRIIEIAPPAPGIDVAILDLTIQNGITPAATGGGIFNSSPFSTLLLSNCRVINNQTPAGGAGGGIFNFGDLTIDNCQIDNNTAGAVGGGIFSTGPGSLSILSSSVSGNTLSSGGAGGGIYTTNTGPLLIGDSQINNNQIPNGAGSGGGIYCPAAVSPANFLNSTISGNTLPAGGSGGGIYCFGSLNFDQVLISNNKISTGGGFAGGAFLVGTPSLFINNSTISGNQITGGFVGGLLTAGTSTVINNSTINNNFGDLAYGGLFPSSDLFEMTNSTVTGNQTNGFGGGMVVTTTSGGSINNSTIVGNQADLDGAGGGPGGGIVIGGPLTLRNTILAQNTDDGTGPDCTCPPGFCTSAGYNLIGTDVGCTIAPPQGDPTSTDLYGVDPMLDALADNGGPTQTMALQEGSPALDGGNPSGCMEGVDMVGPPPLSLLTLLDQDQRGQVRPAGGRCDIGAFELGTADLEVVKTASEPGSVTGAEITYTITVTNNGPDDSFNLTLTDTLPAEVTLVSFDSADADCTEAGGTITCLALTLSAGEGFTVTIVVTMDEEGEIENTATVTGSDIDPDPDNNSSTVTVNVTQSFVSGGGCALEDHSNHSSKSLWLGMAALLVTFFILRKKIAAHRYY